MLNEDGTLVWAQRLRTWGKADKSQVIASNNPDYHVGCHFRFLGQYEDEESGLYYNRFRYYNPQTAQYISPDPIGLAGGINLYAYAPNPLSWIDPLGLAAYSVERWTKWGNSTDKISKSLNKLGERALKNSGGNWKKSEELFNKYIGMANDRLSKVESKYRIEIQPAIKNGIRVPAVTKGPVYSNGRWHTGFRYTKGSKRLDAGIYDITSKANEHGLHPIIEGFDITLNSTKAHASDIYKDVFGGITINDIRILK
ncbi:RHS family protein [Xenorhabdus cabanillasii JM26]|nr:RHS family protein [Xenorhabdus cabanillasii JM26]